MSYRQLSPCTDLAPYIDANWIVTGKKINDAVEKNMPDGCNDIILNLGEDCHVNDSNLLMKNRHAYLVGTMTCYKEITRPRDTNLVGIRFKPAAFSFFYKYSSLHEIADKTVEFDKKSCGGLKGISSFIWVSAPKSLLISFVTNLSLKRSGITLQTKVYLRLLLKAGIMITHTYPMRLGSIPVLHHPNCNLSHFSKV